jgi:diaminohydroxyphosphoribosylaminopyrimidine deaminase/5-amino-6-(5-phosphoribosylamino)uracil reductase
MADEVDQHHMHRAIELARATIGLASPNPQVGCVLVNQGNAHEEKILGEGAHRYDDRDHAEIVALKQAAERGHSVEGATAYVTLEPCSHHGRTGPCADALIAAKIARCVVATVDPNPLVSGQGIAKLRAAGIDVTIGVLEQQARDLNDAFAHFVQTRRPFVTLKAALSVDGKLAPPAAQRTSGQPHWLTGSEARAEVHRLRHASDALLTGIGTVLADDPTLTDRSGLPRRRPLHRVILDTHLRLPLTSQLVRSAANDLLIVCGAEAPPRHLAALAAHGIEVLPVAEQNGHLSLAAVLKELARRNLLSVLLEAGSHLNGAFLTQSLVDKAVLFYAESELGDGALPFATGIPSPFLFEQSLRRVTRTTFGPPERPDARVTGYLNYPWPPA